MNLQVCFLKLFFFTVWACSKWSRLKRIGGKEELGNMYASGLGKKSNDHIIHLSTGLPFLSWIDLSVCVCICKGSVTYNTHMHKFNSWDWKGRILLQNLSAYVVILYIVTNVVCLAKKCAFSLDCISLQYPFCTT